MYTKLSHYTKLPLVHQILTIQSDKTVTLRLETAFTKLNLLQYFVYFSDSPEQILRLNNLKSVVITIHQLTEAPVTLLINVT